jgi:large subunit ribosomal protein L41
MSKYLSKSAKKNLPLTTKRAGKGFYKGKGGTKEGRLTSKAKFVVDPLKRLELVVPDLTGFKVCSFS